MAVLKDLIVHGASRFLSKSYFDSLEADSGAFKKIIAKDATVTNATVMGLLDVTGELHTKSWSNSNIATIDGSFYITPTFGLQGGDTSTNTVTVAANSLSFTNSSGTNFNFDSLYLDGSDSAIAWTTSSKVIVTGEILKDGEWIPLGTLKGTLGTYSTTSVVINNITDAKGAAPATLAALVGSGLRYRNVKVSLISIYRESKLRPLGIFMTATGANGRTFLDIYGGNNEGNSTYAGLSTPVLRIGNLKGLPAIQGVTPSGWGIYTTNGFFSGTVAADRGKIGGWNIGTDTNKSLYTGTFNSSGGVYISPSYSGTLSVVSGAKNWAFTAGNAFGVTTAGVLYASGAQIQGDLKANTLATGTKISSTSGDGFYVDGSGNIYVGNGSTNNFTVTAAGTLNATGATISGILTAGADSSIGPWTVTDTSIYKGNATHGTSGSGNMYFGNSGLSISNTFLVDNAGNLSATGAVFKNVILKDGSNNTRACVDGNGMHVYDNNGVESANFGATGFRMGAITDGETRLVANGGGIDLIRRDDTSDSVLAHFGYGVGIAESGTAVAPYYTFGTRESGSTVGNYSMAIGENITASGWRSYAEGFLTVASGGRSHAEGNRSVASGSESHAEGYKTTASSSYTHAEGYESAASGRYSHAEGVGTTSSGAQSHAEGSGTTSSGAYSHAEGYESTAFGNYSHAQNRYTVANGEAQTAIGKYNQPNTTSAFIIGNGTSATALSNAFAVDWDGNVKAKGDIYVNCNADSSGTAYIGQVFNWQGNLKSNLTANAGAYVEGNGSITLKGGHVYLILAYVAMTNSTNGTVDRRAQIFNKTANAAVLTGDKFVASQAWGTVETQTIYEANEDVTLTVRGSASRPTTTIPTAWIRAVCIA